MAGWSKEDIKAACKGSTEIEIKAETVRRADNKPLPEKIVSTDKKRDQKSADKQADAIKEDEYDNDGKIIMVDKDYENPIIVSYDAKVDPKEDDFKVDWKQVEKVIKEQYPKLKLIYSRMD